MQAVIFALLKLEFPSKNLSCAIGLDKVVGIFENF
jgi:hypothetical protein